MNNIDLSIICPSIRPENLVDCYNSILESCKKYTFEFIIISPAPLPSGLDYNPKVKYIRDFGSLVRCSQIGAILSEGTYIHPNYADDALFLPDSIDKNMDYLLSLGDNYKNIITCKYSESKNFEAPERFQNDDYYKLNKAYGTNPEFIPDDWWIMNSTFLTNKYFRELGGFNCFLSTCVAHSDFSIRAYQDGANVKLSPYAVTKTNWGQSFHEPIEFCQGNIDMPIFRKYYNQPRKNIRTKIPLDNWLLSERVWSHRFKIQNEKTN